MGLELKESMRKGVKSSSMAVLLLSPEYAKSEACNFELKTILACGIPLVACLVEQEGAWRDWPFTNSEGVESRPLSDLAVDEENFVDLGLAAAAEWRDEPGKQPVESRLALYHTPEALPRLIKLVERARKEGASRRGQL
jgi:hypothetical protein